MGMMFFSGSQILNKKSDDRHNVLARNQKRLNKRIPNTAQPI
jgi:hypothetical protein